MIAVQISFDFVFSILTTSRLENFSEVLKDVPNFVSVRQCCTRLKTDEQEGDDIGNVCYGFHKISCKEKREYYHRKIGDGEANHAESKVVDLHSMFKLLNSVRVQTERREIEKQQIVTEICKLDE